MPLRSTRPRGALPIGLLAGLVMMWPVAPGPAAANLQNPSEVPGPLEGFLPRGDSAEQTLEQAFDADLSPADARSWMQQMSSAPNQVGSPHDKANAQFLLQKFRDWGWDAAIEEFSVLYPTPLEETVEMTAPSRFVAKLREPPVEGDATSRQSAGVLPPYNVYGADGDVTADLVYVNQGMPDDYDELERRNVSVKGRIVIVRYGGGWRGLKPKLAYEHGAAGCLIYSDPRDDGYGAGDAYPKGGFRPRDGVQRGSVQDLTLYSGDPLTPGVGATAAAPRLALKDARTVLKIPVLPISYADAEPLLAALGGRVAPASWRGGLPITYHVGPGPARVHLKIKSDWRQRPVYDVIARLRGTLAPDQWVIRGNHHDAWVFGAADPLSGHVAMMAEAKAIGSLLKSGWRPKRTLIYASWDGEEPGLLGSTEWVEAHAAELSAKAVLYVNSDMNGRGMLDAEGSHALQHFVSEVARDVKDPETGVPVLTRALAERRTQAYESGRTQPAGTDLPLGALGSGSDYSPFLQHLGINSLNVEFRGEGDYGVYHSAYDSFDHFRRFVDPSFEYEIALAKVAGRIMLRTAQADVLPARESDLASAVSGFDEELHKLADGMRARGHELDSLLDDGDFALAADPLLPRSPPRRADEVPFLGFADLDNAVALLQTTGVAFDTAYRHALADDSRREERARLDTALAGLELTLTDARGLPGREWYRHMLYAPGVRTGYGVKTLPGIREAIEARRWDEANVYIGVVARALNAYSERLATAVPAAP
jgi:N-acetylated-alpha-linked acidic dipeptidase